MRERVDEWLSEDKENSSVQMTSALEKIQDFLKTCSQLLYILTRKRDFDLLTSEDTVRMNEKVMFVRDQIAIVSSLRKDVVLLEGSQ